MDTSTAPPRPARAAASAPPAPTLQQPAAAALLLQPLQEALPTLPLRGDRLWRRLETLSGFTRPDLPWTRRAFSPEFIAARAWLQGEFASAGLAVRLDAAGNLIGRREGRMPGAPALMSGSHSDTVTQGGRFDGILGVVAALEVAHALHDAGQTWHHPLEVVDFLAEEPTDHGVSCVGSRAMAGLLDLPLLQATDPLGETLAQALRRIGGMPELIDTARREPGSLAAFVELHIEQGPVLEQEHLAIGVVTHIVGIHRVEITVTGQPDHAGTTPMALRRDALAGAAALITLAHHRARALNHAHRYVVATVGRMAVEPNSTNTVPGLVRMSLEVRSDDPEVLRSFADELLRSAEGEMQRCRVAATARTQTLTQPTRADEGVIAAIEQAARRHGHAHRCMPSGAGHDAAPLARIAPMGMVFIPCRGGRSHCAREWSDPEQVLAGTQVLAATLQGLDRQWAAT